MSVLSVARHSLLPLRPQPLTIKTAAFVQASGVRTISHFSTNPLLPQPPLKLQNSPPILGISTQARISSSTECARPKSGTDPKTATLIATSCKNSKTRTHAATASDALMAAIYSDMVQQISRYQASNAEALHKFTRLGPMLEGLKEAFREVRDAHAGSGDENKKAVTAAEKLGELSNYTDGELPEELKKLDRMWGSLWDSRREVERIRRWKVEWCGRWCGHGECPEGAGEDLGKGDDKIEEVQQSKSKKLEAQKSEPHKPADSTKEPKNWARSLISEQQKMNELFFAEIKDQKLELDLLKPRLRKMEQRLKKVEYETSRIYHEDHDDDEDDLQKLFNHAEDNDDINNAVTKKPETDEQQRWTQQVIDDQRRIIDEQQRVIDANCNFESRSEFFEKYRGENGS